MRLHPLIDELEMKSCLKRGTEQEAPQTHITLGWAMEGADIWKSRYFHNNDKLMAS